MNEDKKTPPFWTEGSRKLIVSVTTILAFAAIAITLLIKEPEGVSIMEFLGWAGSLLLGGQGIFTTGNILEHRARSSAGPTNILGSSLAIPFMLLLLVGVGCSTSSQQGSYLPILQGSLAASETLTTSAQAQAVQSRSLTACLASGALRGAIASASDALTVWSRAEPDSYTLPGVKVDVSPCAPIANQERFEPLLSSEAAVEVRRYTEGLAPLALTVTRAAVVSSGLDCRERLVVLAVLSYLEGALPPVVEELVEPDGLVEIPAVKLELASCG